MAETPHSPEPQDDQTPAPMALGSYGTPASSEGPSPDPIEPEPTAVSAAESGSLPLGYGASDSSTGSTSIPMGYSAVNSAAETSSSEAWSATVASDQPETPPATQAASPFAGSYGGSYGGSSTATTARPAIGSSVHVPPLEGESGEGGEWDLLTGKLRDWFHRNDLGGQWDRLGGPLRASGLLVGGLILIKLYEALLETLDDIPLLPRLLQLAGLLYLLNFGFTHLIKSQDRENLINSWKKSWHDFTGRP